MTAAHTGTAILASTSNAAGANVDSSVIDNTAGYGAIITALVTNGGTGPTVGCTVTVYVSHDNSAWKQFYQGLAGTANSTTYPWVFEIPAAVLYAKVNFGGNTAQAVTVEAQAHKLTGV